MIALDKTADLRFRIDKVLLAGLLGLMVLGAFFIYSATLAHEANDIPWYRERWIMQSFFCLAGLFVAFLICLVDYHSLARWAFVGYWGMILLLVLVLIPGIGVMRFGARRWFDLGIWQLQPSEFAKLAFIFAQAHFLSRPADELRLPINFFKSIGLMALPFLLILKEPDLGSALVLVPVGLVMMYAGGVPVKFLRRLVIGVGVVVALFVVDVLYAPPQW